MSRSLKNWLVLKSCSRISRLRARFSSSCGSCCGPGGVGQEPLQVVEGHVRIGTARQQTAERMAQLAQGLDTDGGGEMAEVSPGTLGVAHAPEVQQAAGVVERFETVAQVVKLHGGTSRNVGESVAIEPKEPGNCSESTGHSSNPTAWRGKNSARHRCCRFRGTSSSARREGHWRASTIPHVTLSTVQPAEQSSEFLHIL